MKQPISASSCLNVYRLDGTLSDKSVSPRTNAFSGKEVNKHRFSRVSEGVTGDRRLDDIDVRVYCALTSGITKGNVSTVSVRRVKELSGKSMSAIVESLKTLIACGHIEKTPVRSGMRACYTLLAPVFNGGKVSHLGETVATSDLPQKMRPTIAKCGDCHKPRVLRKTGWCKGCEEKHDRVREMEGVVVRMVGRELIA